MISWPEKGEYQQYQGPDGEKKRKKKRFIDDGYIWLEKLRDGLETAGRKGEAKDRLGRYIYIASDRGAEGRLWAG